MTAGSRQDAGRRLRLPWKADVARALLAIALSFSLHDGVWAQEEAPHGAYTGSVVCGTCHEGEFAAWRRSHHADAMRLPTRETVRAPFSGETIESDGIMSEFLRRGEDFVIRTAGPDGAPAEFKVAYTFGVAPLQQYLIALPGGRYQAFNLAWDARPAAEGGQRWFDLYPDDELRPGDPLHWTGIDQIWNYQCAWCHSTDLQKNYDPQTDTFATTWAEISVGCEACHGAGRDHVARAREAQSGGVPATGTMGLAVTLQGRSPGAWEWGDGPTARLTGSRNAREIDVCAGCHARRGQFSAAHPQTGPALDSFRPALLEPGLYYADGQQREEVFKWGSFLQSRMHEAGVICSDCHDPHSGETLLEGNALCGQCHQPAEFDTPAHHFHEAGTEGARCASCHMPTTDYMIVDARRDHSFRIPRPELTVEHGMPNACNRCHQDRDAEWALRALDGWQPERSTGFQDFAGIFAEFDRGQPGSREELIRYLEEHEAPVIAAASALQRLASQPSVEALSAAVPYLKSPEALERSAAISMAALVEPPARLTLLAPLLTDDSRLVRMDAARALAGPTERLMDARTREAFESALAEYVAAQNFDAERPESNANLAALHLERRDLPQARQFYEAALRRDPGFVPATIGLARVLREMEGEEAVETVLRNAAEAQPRSPEIAHALGLTLVRRGARDDALGWLSRAATLGPHDPRFTFVHAVALHDMGREGQAIATLEEALVRHPYDRDLLRTLLSYQIEVGDWPGAVKAATRLSALEPGNKALRDLLPQLRQRP